MNNRKRNIRSDRFGVNFRDFARGYMTNNQHPATELEIIGCIAANEMGVTISPNSNVIKFAISKMRTKWGRINNVNPNQLDGPKRFSSVINKEIVNFLEGYGDEFLEFVQGDTQMLKDPRIPTKHKKTLLLIDSYLQEVNDHVRY